MSESFVRAPLVEVCPSPAPGPVYFPPGHATSLDQRFAVLRFLLLHIRNRYLRALLVEQMVAELKNAAGVR